MAQPTIAQEHPSVFVNTALVQEQEVVDGLATYGVLTADPDQVQSISLSHAGLINRVWVRLGQRVESGDRLLEIITAPEARMQFLQAQGALEYAKQDLDRQRRLLSEQLATNASVEAARKNLADAQATLEALKQRGQGADTETLFAPKDGVITQLNVSQGQRVQAETTAMLIAAESPLVARLGIEPEDIGRIKPATKVIISSVFNPQAVFNSEVREVHAMIDPNTHLVEVLVPISPDEQDQVALGTRVTGELQLGISKSIVVPRSAILLDRDQSYVFIVVDNIAKRIDVSTGTESVNSITVTGALKVGDRVVMSGNYQLVDGMRVREKP